MLDIGYLHDEWMSSKIEFLRSNPLVYLHTRTWQWTLPLSCGWGPFSCRCPVWWSFKYVCFCLIDIYRQSPENPQYAPLRDCHVIDYVYTSINILSLHVLYIASQCHHAQLFHDWRQQRYLMQCHHYRSYEWEAWELFQSLFSCFTAIFSFQ